MSLLTSNDTRSCDPDNFHVASCTRQFDFALIFEQSILSILPASLFIIVGLVRAYLLYGKEKKTCFGKSVFAKTGLCLVLSGLNVALCVLWSQQSRDSIITSLPASGLALAASLVICILVHLEDRYTIKPANLTTLYLLVSLLFDAAQARTLFLRDSNDSSLAAVLVAVIATKVVLVVLENQSKRSDLRSPYDKYPPEALSGPLNTSLFLWINSLFRTGWRKTMTVDDLFEIDQHLSSSRLTERMKQKWALRGCPETRITLPWTVARCFKAELFLVAIPRLCLIGFNYAQPFLIQRAIILLSESRSTQSDDNGYGLIGAAFFVYVGIAISTVHYQHRFYRVITMFRGAMVGLIYDHSLALPDGACPESSAITLMSTDVESIIEALQEVNEIWARLIEVAIGVWLLARQVGAPCVVPIILVVACTAGQSWVSSRIGGSMKNWNEAIEKRVSVTSSFLNSIKAVKMMGLSDVLAKSVQALRVHELYLCKFFMRNILYLNVIAIVPSAWSAALTFVAFTIQARVKGEPALGTAQAFTSLAIISLVTTPAQMLLVTLPKSAAAMGAFTRIQDFLLLPALASRPRIRKGTVADASPAGSNGSNAIEMVRVNSKNANNTAKDAIKVTDCTIKPTSTTEAVLSDVNLNVIRGTLTCIVGPVGSGKTLLLRTILGELEPSQGSIDVSTDRIAYCSQTSWLKNASVQQNICNLTRNQAVDERWYRSVLFACALDDDISQMPNGDMTVIGSGGISLSGGQRQRLALARALYSRNQVFLLDDVLSALDTKTADLVISRTLGKQGILKKIGATVVLVTHSVRVLQHADLVLIAGKGTLQQGSLPDVEALGLDQETESDQTAENKHARDVTAPSVDLAQPVSEQKKLDLTRRVGDFSVYKYYGNTIGRRLIILFVAINLSYAFVTNFPQVLLKFWTGAGGGQLGLYLTLYLLLAAAATILMGGTIWIMFLKMMPKSAARLHGILLHTVVEAPLSFFTDTDAGEVLNRFSQDMSLVDMPLPIGLSEVAMDLSNSLFQAALIATGSGYMAITLPFVFIALYFIQDVYLKTSRQLRLLDLEAKSPLYSHFIETLEGASTIRAFGWSHMAMETLLERLDTSQRPYYMLFCVQRWLNLVLDLLVAGLAVCVVALAVELRSSTDPGLLGIALNNILNFNSTLSQLVTAWTTFEISLGAISRVKSFSRDTASERTTTEDLDPPADWPAHGAIEFRHVSAQYAEGKPALEDISMAVSPGQKIGICGRTGSGKSSLLVTLLRLLNTTHGTIMIDGIDISRVPRETLRQRLLAVPQDPFVLAGSARYNIDPTSRASEESMVTALEKLGLRETIDALGGLDVEISARSLSQGQLQLFCLARALVSSAKVVLLDEATSNVDRGNDEMVQRVLREEFRDRVVLVVAHRIDTILDSDRIAVLDRGRLIEFDTPENLLARDSEFRKLHGA